MALTLATELANYAAGIGTQGATLKIDSANKRVGVGTTNPQGPEGSLQVGTGITFFGNTGIISAIGGKFSGDFTVGGTLTYEDVQNVNSSGVGTFSGGINIVGGGLTVTGVSTFFSALDVNSTADFAGAISVGDTISLGDHDRLRFGDGNDLQIYHNGNHSYIDDTGTGDLYIRGDNALKIQNAAGTEQKIVANTDGSVELYHNNNKKFETTSYGALFTDNVLFDNPDTAGRDLTWEADNDALHWEDNTKATFGAGNDLQIYHDESHSRIVDSGTGHLIIQTSELDLMNAAGNEDMIKATQDGSVEIYHNGTKKFETGPAGVIVTGVSTADGFDVGDNEYITAGIGSDLAIYHDSSHSHIVSKTGNLRILADGAGSLVLTAKAGEEAITCAQDGAVTIKHDNSTKLETSATGVTVTGTLNATTAITENGNALATNGKAVAMALVFG